MNERLPPGEGKEQSGTRVQPPPSVSEARSGSRGWVLQNPHFELARTGDPHPGVAVLAQWRPQRQPAALPARGRRSPLSRGCPGWRVPATAVPLAAAGRIRKASRFFPPRERLQTAGVDRGRGGTQAPSPTRRVHLPAGGRGARSAAWLDGQMTPGHGSSGGAVAGHRGSSFRLHRGRAASRGRFLSRKATGRRRGGGFSRLLFHTLGGCPVALLRHLTGLRAGSLVLTLPVTGPCARGAWTCSGHRKTASMGDSASVSELATHTCALLPETSPAVCGWQGACRAAP